MSLYCLYVNSFHFYSKLDTTHTQFFFFLFVIVYKVYTNKCIVFNINCIVYKKVTCYILQTIFFNVPKLFKSFFLNDLVLCTFIQNGINTYKLVFQYTAYTKKCLFSNFNPSQNLYLGLVA